MILFHSRIFYTQKEKNKVKKTSIIPPEALRHIYRIQTFRHSTALDNRHHHYRNAKKCIIYSKPGEIESK